MNKLGRTDWTCWHAVGDRAKSAIQNGRALTGGHRIQKQIVACCASTRRGRLSIAWRRRCPCPVLGPSSCKVSPRRSRAGWPDRPLEEENAKLKKLLADQILEASAPTHAKAILV